MFFRRVLQLKLPLDELPATVRVKAAEEVTVFKTIDLRKVLYSWQVKYRLIFLAGSPMFIVQCRMKKKV